MSAIRFVFVGRIAPEKWIDRIIRAVDGLYAVWVRGFEVHIIGSGVLLDRILDHPLYHQVFFYHGRLPKDQTIALWKTMHMTLMPSQFLETFWLVALDSLALGIPILWPQQWWLSQFVEERWIIRSPQELQDTMYRCIEHYPSEIYTQWSVSSLALAQHYTPKARVDRLWQLSNDVKKLLFLSDYVIDVGGIESMLFEMRKLLSTYGYDVMLEGKHHRAEWWTRYLDLVIAWLNIPFAFFLTNHLKKNSYDLIWLHSIQRRIGRLPLLVVHFLYKGEVWLTFHEFGLIHPFPSAVVDEQQLVDAQSFFWYMHEWKEHLWGIWWWGGWVVVFLKRCYTHFLFFVLRRVVDKFFVPSAFLVPYYEKRGIQTIVYPHFVSHIS